MSLSFWAWIPRVVVSHLLRIMLVNITYKYLCALLFPVLGIKTLKLQWCVICTSIFIFFPSWLHGIWTSLHSQQHCLGVCFCPPAFVFIVFFKNSHSKWEKEISIHIFLLFAFLTVLVSELEFFMLIGHLQFIFWELSYSVAPFID